MTRDCDDLPWGLLYAQAPDTDQTAMAALCEQLPDMPAERIIRIGCFMLAPLHGPDTRLPVILRFAMNTLAPVILLRTAVANRVVDDGQMRSLTHLRETESHVARLARARTAANAPRDDDHWVLHADITAYTQSSLMQFGRIHEAVEGSVSQLDFAQVESGISQANLAWSLYMALRRGEHWQSDLDEGEHTHVYYLATAILPELLARLTKRNRMEWKIETSIIGNYRRRLMHTLDRMASN